MGKKKLDDASHARKKVKSKPVVESDTDERASADETAEMVNDMKLEVCKVHSFYEFAS